MDAWATFWGWLLVIVLVIYAGLAIVITIGGFFDVKGMLTTIDAQHESATPAEGKEDEESR